MNTFHVNEGYNKVAKKYAETFYNELDNKPLDRYLLNEFCSRLRKGSKICDIGCGPGHVSRYVKNMGLDVFGIDLSEGMLNIAREKSPDIEFAKGNMMDLGFKEESLGGVLLFYSIVHFTFEEIERVFKDLWRILEKDGIMFIAFHVGDKVLHVDSLFDEKVEMDYMFFDTEKVVEILYENNYRIIEAITRYPYEDYEYNSKRGYIICQKVSLKKLTGLCNL